jgi:hypothetical protein
VGDFDEALYHLIPQSGSLHVGGLKIKNHFVHIRNSMGLFKGKMVLGLIFTYSSWHVAAPISSWI